MFFVKFAGSKPAIMSLRAQQIRWFDKRTLKESWTKASLAPMWTSHPYLNISCVVLGKYAQVASSRSASMSCKTSLGRALVCPSWEKIWSNASFISLGLLVWMESNRGKKWYELRKYKSRKDYQVDVTENNNTSRGLFILMDGPYGLASRMWKRVKDKQWIPCWSPISSGPWPK